MNSTLSTTDVADVIIEPMTGVMGVRSENHPRLKQRIAENFSRAAHSYDEAAILQKRVAARTMLGLPAQLAEVGCQNKTHRVLDLGSGTGLHSLMLADRYANAMVTGMDLAMGMLEFARQNADGYPRVNWCSGDIESIPLQSGAIDLIYSSLAIQWCCFEKVLSEVSRVLRPGGSFVFSTLAEGSLKELDAAWCLAGESDRVNRFNRFEAQQQSIVQSDFSPRTFSLKAETLYYPDIITLLRGLKALGVNTVLAGNDGLLTRRKLEVLKQAYESFRQPDGLPLTYQVIYGVLQKPL
ncbi:malonyl-ACP O-methyltransferase BioC [Endozoicomonas sp.]|uniref:malonyl-ACP O-methyltransferase BioC n=1 Tax=Endozoicomonas sp. TaxID=1892382 RepID=UPI002886A861|nr:malonyl-ACP O-methyltransferase BioC [Endozoicomonas sp.]